MRARSRTAARPPIVAAAALLLVVAFLAGRATTHLAPTPPAGPGPFHTVDGVTVGFRRSPAGADAAAAHYLLEIERAMDTLSAQRTAVVAGLDSTGSEAQALRAHAGEVIALERAHGAPLRRVAIRPLRSLTRRLPRR